MVLLTRIGIRINICCSMADFQFSKWQLFDILDFQKLEMLTPGPVRRHTVRHMPNFAKIHWTVPVIWPIFDFSRYRLPHHLGFWKFQILNGWDAQSSRTASACRILAKSLKPRLRYGDFSIFHDGGRPQCWIFKSWKFQLPVTFGGQMYVIVPNFAKISQTVPEIWPIFDFSGWRPPPSWILEILKF